MLIYLGIKTITILGYGFQGVETTANQNYDENGWTGTDGHTWTGV